MPATVSRAISDVTLVQGLLAFLPNLTGNALLTNHNVPVPFVLVLRPFDAIEWAGPAVSAIAHGVTVALLGRLGRRLGRLRGAAGDAVELGRRLSRRRVHGIGGIGRPARLDHIGGRAQPGDVLGLETGGETTAIGDTAEDEDEQRMYVSKQGYTASSSSLEIDDDDHEMPPGEAGELVLRADDTSTLVRWNGKRYRGDLAFVATDTGVLVVNDGVKVIAGFGLTPLALAAAPIATQAKVPQIVMARYPTSSAASSLML